MPMQRVSEAVSLGGGADGRKAKLVIHLHLTSKLRIRGAILLLHHTPSYDVPNFFYLRGLLRTELVCADREATSRPVFEGTRFQSRPCHDYPRYFCTNAQTERGNKCGPLPSFPSLRHRT
jgi:hypothetical protein